MKKLISIVTVVVTAFALTMAFSCKKENTTTTTTIIEDVSADVSADMTGDAM
jgi:hypothetical protein